jgi:hypothetical protein
MLEKAAKDSKGLQDSLEDLVAKLEADGKAPGYSGYIEPGLGFQ